jgi:hypothetical protein
MRERTRTTGPHGLKPRAFTLTRARLDRAKARTATPVGLLGGSPKLLALTLAVAAVLVATPPEAVAQDVSPFRASLDLVVADGVTHEIGRDGAIYFFTHCSSPCDFTLRGRGWVTRQGWRTC